MKISILFFGSLREERFGKRVVHYLQNDLKKRKPIIIDPL